MSPSPLPETVAAPGLVSAPVDPVELPASLSALSEVTTATDAGFARVAVTAPAGDIPSTALAAYQRAETVINAADRTCHLSWQLVAAIGRVESDHGTSGGSAIGADGVARPAILGPVLDGDNGTLAIRDTDAGQYDGDARFDRAVGPMQFIASTWSVVGVDADSDGVRDPQDIDDAALAAAVYLCSGTEDLADLEGQRASVFRYNHSGAYVETVLSIMNAYLDGDFDSVPGPTVSAGSLVPLESHYPVSHAEGPPNGGPTLLTNESANPLDLSSTGAEPLWSPTVQVPSADPSDPTLPVDPSTEPTDPTPSADPSDPPTGPSDSTTDPTASGDVETDAPTSGQVEPTEPSEDAVLSCTDAGYLDDPAVDDDEFDLCVIVFDEAVAAAEPTSTPISTPTDALTGEPTDAPTTPARDEASH